MTRRVSTKSRRTMRPFGRSLPMQLLRAREAVMQEFRPHLRRHGLTEQQWRIIRALSGAEAMEINELGGTCTIHPASLSRMLPALEKAGAIDRRADRHDQRRTLVSLSARGRTLFEKIAPESEQIYADIERRIGPAKLRALYELLDHVLGTLNPRQDGDPTR